MKKPEKNQKKLASNPYNPTAFESKWQSKWENDGIYHPDLDSAKSPFYNLMMFPYPSAEGLHIGGVRTFSGVDIYGRFKRMKGYDVFQPFGLDGFGIHAENYALKIGANPMSNAEITEKNFYRQIREVAIGVDWGRTVETYKKDYYKWTQWVFTELFKEGMAYRKKSPVNFCPSCATVLADEQVIDTKCERCSSVVVKKNLEQWFFRITSYADRLLNNIEKLDWTEKVKIAQRNWIGKSNGALIKFKISSDSSGQEVSSNFQRETTQNTTQNYAEAEIEVFTTAIDTIYGVTFMVISPDHPLVEAILNRKLAGGDLDQIQKYVNEAKNKPELERLAEGKEKTGVPAGVSVTNPFNGEDVPVWIADYVLMGYGTGAVMGVPGHDGRDHEFAKKFKLPVKPVVKPIKDGEGVKVEKDGFWDYPEIKTKYGEKSELFDSGEFSGLTSVEAKKRMLEYIKDKGFGESTTTYHLRDWLISRQRYWGPPIPMIYCEACAAGGSGDREEMPGWYVVPEKDLPVELPYIEDFKPLGTGVSPLGNHPEFYIVKCPHCAKPAKRETDVSDTFLDSAWYFFRYISTEFADKVFDSERAAKWLPVTMYIGGAEHSVLHLLYSRFITMFLKDKGLIEFEEPFAKFYAHGLIIKEGAKMSKSKGNVVGPDIYVKKYGADTLRMYLHFLAPFNQDGDFRDEGIQGMSRFLTRVWKLMLGAISDGKTQNNAEQKAKQRRTRAMHQAIKDVTEEMEALRFNTAIAHLMTYYNFLSKEDSVSKEEAEVYLKLLAPFAPHMAEELYQNVILSVREGSSRDSSAKPQNDKKFESIHLSSWPTYDEKYLVADTVKIPVQVNGKLRSMLEVSSSDVSDKAKVEEMARKDEKIAKSLEGQTVKQAIYIPGKVLNFVV